jgi:DNA-binding HxlR family transcriptional regulator/RimJ/RimL family protein N-acetyltransferase
MTPAPGRPVRGSTTGRPLMAALDLLGRRWALRILWELRDAPLGARALRDRCDKMSTSVLYARLSDLTSAGLVEQNGDDHYLLTDLGRSLSVAIGPLHAWSQEWAAALVEVAVADGADEVREATLVEVTVADEADAVRQAAAIWARAKARRDQAPAPATVEETMPGIRRRLDLDGAKLLLARRDGRPVGFTLFAPRARTLEVFYLAVDPDAWGGGVAGRLLLSVETHARELGRETLELWVIDDNERAIGVYQRAGWVGTDEVRRDASSDRLERRFRRHLR